MTASIIDLQLAYIRFRKTYGRMLRSAKREMTTPLQKALVDTISTTAFSAGYNSPRVKAEPLKLKGWKAGNRRI